MTLKEMLSQPETKKMFRDLAKAYHPDRKFGDQTIMQQIKKAKESGDEAIKTLYNDLIKKRETVNLKDIRKENVEFDKYRQWIREISIILDKSTSTIDFILQPALKDNGTIDLKIVVIDRWNTKTIYLFNLNQYKNKKKLTAAILNKITSEA